MPDDALRCERCGRQAANTASAAPQPQEPQQAAATEKGSRTSRMRVLGAVLASPVFLVVSCNGIAAIGYKVTTVVENGSRQIPIEEVKQPRFDVAIVATTAEPSSAGSTPLVYWLAREPKEDPAEFLRRHPGYSFLPSNDRDVIRHPDTETNVEYWVLKRESGKALVKTHMNHYVLMGLDVRATYEATDSDIRLISYKAGSDLGIWPIVWGPMFASLLALIGEILLGRIAKSELQTDRRDVGVWAKALAEAKGNVRKAESRYIAKRVKLLKRSGGAETKTASSALAAGLAPAPQKPIPNVRTRILVDTVAAFMVNACAYELENPGYTMAAYALVWGACVPLILAVLAWVIVSLMRGAKFKASWRVYEGTLLAVTALRLLGAVIHVVQH